MAEDPNEAGGRATIAPLIDNQREEDLPVRFHEDDQGRAGYLAHHYSEELTLLERLWLAELYMRSISLLFTDDPRVANVLMPIYVAERAKQMKIDGRVAEAETVARGVPMLARTQFDMTHVLHRPAEGGGSILDRLGFDQDRILADHHRQKSERDQHRFMCPCGHCMSFRRFMGLPAGPTDVRVQ